jgi:hypothetical protein
VRRRCGAFVRTLPGADEDAYRCATGTSAEGVLVPPPRPGRHPRAYVRNAFTAVDPLGLAPDCERALQATKDRANVEQGREGANKYTRPTSTAGFQQHARCGEPEALSNAVRAGVAPRGGTIAAVEVRAEGNLKHGVPKAICSSCQHVLGQLDITAVT